ncbi:MAG: hydrolase [Candidatus Binatia bacterium]
MWPFVRELEWVARQRERMERLVRDWASIPSQSHDVEGLTAMAGALESSFAALGAVELVELPPATEIDGGGRPAERPLGRALRITKRPAASRRVFLGGHMDTVHARAQAPPLELLAGGRLRGPGVADAKGGLVVLRIALEALERSAVAGGIGWEIVINPDEELGSPGSGALIQEVGRNTGLGLVFEPAFADGALVGARKGSGYFTAVVRGRAAHVGRDFAAGRSAVAAAARLAVALDRLNGSRRGAIVNVGKISGGGALNVVPDLAIAGFNVRCDGADDQVELEREIAAIVAAERDYGLEVELHGHFSAPPKPLDEPTSGLLRAIAACGRDLGIEITWRATGGVSDGNRLAAAGVTTVDTLGPCGGEIHSPGEYLMLDSLVERARLVALVLLRLAAGDIACPSPRREPK